MRISIVTGPFFPIPPAPCGAVERIWYDLAGEFARRGHDVTILARAADLPAQRGNRVPGKPGIIELSRWTSSRLLAANLGKDFLYATQALSRLPTADILVTNTFWMPVLARLRPSAGRVVVNVARMPKGQMRLYRARVARLAAVSRAVADAIGRECPACVPITRVLPNPIDTAHFVPPAASRYWDGALELAYAGRIHPEKGLAALLEAVALLNRRGEVARVRLIGPWRTEEGGGGREYRATLESLARGLPVEFAEPLHDRGAFAARLQSAHLFCYPSVAERGESFGVAPLEAMATGAVPILSDLACFREFAEPGVNAAVFDHRADTAGRLAAAIDSLLADRALCRRLSERAAADARRFSLANVADAYLSDFEELIRR